MISLQTLLGYRLFVGGRTALELQGYAHYLSQELAEVHLYGPVKPPSWLYTLPLNERFVYHNSLPLFGSSLDQVLLPELDNDRPDADNSTLQAAGLRTLPWGQWDWPLTLAGPERAMLELLNELPTRESFHQVDMLIKGLTDLSPKRLQHLLIRCRSVKAKRLFFFFADRHRHAWLNRLDRRRIALGSGKRKLVADGRYDPTYQITVPKDFADSSDGIR